MTRLATEKARERQKKGLCLLSKGGTEGEGGREGERKKVGDGADKWGLFKGVMCQRYGDVIRSLLF